MAAGSGPEPRTSTSRPLLVAVIWMSSGLVVGFSSFGERAGGVERAVQAGIEDRTIVDRDNGVAVGRGKADLRTSSSPPRRAWTVMRRRPAPWASTSSIDLAGDAGMRQRIDHDLAFPRAIGFGCQVLDGAAAADAEMLAERRDPLRAGVLDARQMPAVGMTGHRFDFDRLAAQRVRHEHGLPAGKGDAVAAMADMIDDETFNHGARR